MSFAALEFRVNASVLRALANARVLIAGRDVPGIFKNGSQNARLGKGVEDTGPNVTVASDAVPEAPVDTAIEINGTPYTVSAHAPDGTGLTVLTVERTE